MGKKPADKDIFTGFAKVREQFTAMASGLLESLKAAVNATDGEDTEAKIKEAQDGLKEKNKHGARNRPRSNRPL